jgi:hypothetical protein
MALATVRPPMPESKMPIGCRGSEVVGMENKMHR